MKDKDKEFRFDELVEQELTPEDGTLEDLVEESIDEQALPVGTAAPVVKANDMDYYLPKMMEPRGMYGPEGAKKTAIVPYRSYRVHLWRVPSIDGILQFGKMAYEWVAELEGEPSSRVTRDTAQEAYDTIAKLVYTRE